MTGKNALPKITHSEIAIDCCVYDAYPKNALLEIDWSPFHSEGPLRARVRLLPYTEDRILWLGMAFGTPILVDLSTGTLTIGGTKCRPADGALFPLENLVTA